MQFEFNDKTQLALDRLRSFMDEHIYPNEEAYYRQHAELEDRWSSPPMLEELKTKAREAGLWNLFLPHSERGAGFTNLEYAPLCDEEPEFRADTEHAQCIALSPATGATRCAGCAAARA